MPGGWINKEINLKPEIIPHNGLFSLSPFSAPSLYVLDVFLRVFRPFSAFFFAKKPVKEKTLLTPLSLFLIKIEFRNF